MEKSTSSALSRLQSLSKSQGTRISLYQEFEDAYQDYLTEKCPPEQYYSICKIVTEGFQEVSQEIQNVEKELTDICQRPDLSRLVRRLQLAEKGKLTHTAQLQIYTIESKNGEKDYATAIQTTKQNLQECLAEVQDVWDELRQEITDLTYTTKD